jgi:hypothetical protein
MRETVRKESNTWQCDVRVGRLQYEHLDGAQRTLLFAGIQAPLLSCQGLKTETQCQQTALGLTELRVLAACRTLIVMDENGGPYSANGYLALGVATIVIPGITVDQIGGLLRWLMDNELLPYARRVIVWAGQNEVLDKIKKIGNNTIPREAAPELADLVMQKIMLLEHAVPGKKVYVLMPPPEITKIMMVTTAQRTFAERYRHELASGLIAIRRARKSKNLIPVFPLNPMTRDHTMGWLKIELLNTILLEVQKEIT